MFDNSLETVGGRAVVLEKPVEIVRADEMGDVPGALGQLERGMERGLIAAGFYSYELGYALESGLHKLMPTGRRVPLLYFALFPHMEIKKRDDLTDFLAQKTRGVQAGQLDNFQLEMSQDDYLHRFARVKELIASGDIYQANLAMKLLFAHKGDPLSLYVRLRQRQPVPYGAFMQADEFAVLSLSPELFFEAENGEIRARPMKGTARRGVTQKQDQALSHELQNDPKNRAENLMIVDLMRNDFARICETGSVRVSDLYRVEPFATLYQMTSGITGRLRAGLPLEELIKALFPAGSITGAPKIRAQQVIRELERGPRGLYCGAMGVMSHDRQSGELSARFNVAIRTLTLFADGTGESAIGSGVVQDSRGKDEYEECLLKARFLTRSAYSLIETMRLDPDGQYYLLQRHLDRLLRSCEELDFLYPLEEIKAALRKQAGALDRGTYRVRLVLDTGGRFEITATKIEPPDPQHVIGFVLSDKRVDSGDHLLAHKTTKRELFDHEWASANKEHGAGEVLFLNERGEYTEGARSNLFIERGGKLLTPPLSCGLLPGTLRKELMAEGRAVEAVLRPKDLLGAKIYFGNSVRGLQPAKLV